MASKSVTKTRSRTPTKKSTSLSNTSQSKTSTLLSDAKTFLNSQTMENVEMEYIKNLQQQVYFLELECNYLREQINTHGISAKSKYKKENDTLKEKIKEIELDKSNLSKSLVDKSLENIYQVLDETQKSFQNDKEILLEEIAVLRREKLESDGRYQQLHDDYSQARVNLERHHQEMRQMKQQLTLFDGQLDQTNKDSIRLRTELTDARNQLNNRDGLIKELQKNIDEQKRTNIQELKSTINDLKTKLTQSNENLKKETESSRHLDEDKQRLLKEVAAYQKQLSDSKIEIQKLNSTLETTLKQNETDLILAQKNANIMKSNVEQLKTSIEEQKTLNVNLQTQIEQFKVQEANETKSILGLKARIRELEVGLENSKTAEIELNKLRDEHTYKKQLYETEHAKFTNENDLLKLKSNDLERKVKDLSARIDETVRNRDSQFTLMQQKIDFLQKNFDDELNNLKIERANNEQLRVTNRALKEQEQTNQAVIENFRDRITQLETRLYPLEAQEKEWLQTSQQLTKAIDELNARQNEINANRKQIEELQLRLSEIDRLKEIENVVKSQQWEQFGALAETMKAISLTNGSNSRTQRQSIGFESLSHDNANKHETVEVVVTDTQADNHDTNH